MRQVIHHAWKHAGNEATLIIDGIIYLFVCLFVYLLICLFILTVQYMLTVCYVDSIAYIP